MEPQAPRRTRSAGARARAVTERFQAVGDSFEFPPEQPSMTTDEAPNAVPLFWRRHVASSLAAMRPVLDGVVSDCSDELSGCSDAEPCRRSLMSYGKSR